jgi:hypothetical protein
VLHEQATPEIRHGAEDIDERNRSSFITHSSPRASFEPDHVRKRTQRI